MEEAALIKFAEQWSQIEELKQAREDRLVELQKEAVKLRVDTKSRIEAVQAQQVAVLVELHEAGRSAEEIATLVELPKDRIRKALRSTPNRTPTGAGAGVHNDKIVAGPSPRSFRSTEISAGNAESISSEDDIDIHALAGDSDTAE